MAIPIPEDLELLQIYNNQDLFSLQYRYPEKKRKTLYLLLDKLSFNEVVHLHLHLMVNSLHMVLSSRLSELEITQELSTGDDHFLDFIFVFRFLVKGLGH